MFEKHSSKDQNQLDIFDNSDKSNQRLLFQR